MVEENKELKKKNYTAPPNIKASR